MKYSRAVDTGRGPGLRNGTVPARPQASFQTSRTQVLKVSLREVPEKITRGNLSTQYRLLPLLSCQQTTVFAPRKENERGSIPNLPTARDLWKRHCVQRTRGVFNNTVVCVKQMKEAGVISLCPLAQPSLTGVGARC